MIKLDMTYSVAVKLLITVISFLDLSGSPGEKQVKKSRMCFVCPSDSMSIKFSLYFSFYFIQKYQAHIMETQQRNPNPAALPPHPRNLSNTFDLCECVKHVQVTFC